VAEPTPLQSGLRGRCPRCGAPGLFAGLISFAAACPRCGLDYRAFNVGDGPAPFLIFGIGTVAVIGAIWLDFSAHPPWWVHALLWPAFTIGLTLAGLRVGKGMLINLEYRNKAAEARTS